MIGRLLLVLAVLMGVMACGEEGNDSPVTNSIQDLILNQSLSGFIGRVGKVDWYHFKAVETNNILEIQLTGPMRSEVEYQVGVYEMDENGQKQRLYADHAPEQSQLAANVCMNIYIEEPKDLFISVRDLLDDEATQGLYTIKVNYVGAPDGNQNFASAEPIEIDAEAKDIQDNIGYIGDVDCYSFKVAQSGVYGINLLFTPFSGGTNVDLTVKLYDADGALIENRTGLSGNEAHIRSYLSGDDEGDKTVTYYVVIEDNGKDDFDTSSFYKLNVESVTVEEAFADDTKDQALELTLESSTMSFHSSGALDYTSSSDTSIHSGDVDWYRMNIDSNDTSKSDTALKISFEDSSEKNQTIYHIQLEDETGTILLSHNFSGSSTTYQNQVKAGSGSHYLVINTLKDSTYAQSAPYSFSVEIVDMDDPVEENGGNDTQSTATALTIGDVESGKIAYRSDVDWYRLDLSTASPHILELFLTSKASSVEYFVELRHKNQILKKKYDINGMDGDTQLKTSLFVPETLSGDATYYIRVGDLQNDDGDVLPYEISVNLLDVPTSVPNAPLGGATYYFSEVEELNQNTDVATDIELEIFSSNQPHFNANMDYLDFRDPGSGVVQTNNNGVFTIELPWIAGYIDYQDDRDFFQINLGPLDSEALDTDYYYDVEVQLMTTNQTDVEYIWKFYRDSNGNGVLMDAPFSPDGYFACDGDQTPNDNSPIKSVTKSGEQKFWVGSQWIEADTKFYFCIQDFNYLKLPASGNVNPLPDDDWGYDSPYYFKIILNYHVGAINP
ncbi:MAG: hypothetical protein PVI90_02420 [Desulfobacteraceae bacterium]|jgi:hypothetical protein